MTEPPLRLPFVLQGRAGLGKRPRVAMATEPDAEWVVDAQVAFLAEPLLGYRDLL